jgi:signal transduction histidine kinase
MVKVDELIREIANQHNNYIQKQNINIIINIDTSLTLAVNKFGIKLILENLIHNAVKYVNTKGFVEITVNNKDNYLDMVIL